MERRCLGNFVDVVFKMGILWTMIAVYSRTDYLLRRMALCQETYIPPAQLCCIQLVALNSR